MTDLEIINEMVKLYESNKEQYKDIGLRFQPCIYSLQRQLEVEQEFGFKFEGANGAYEWFKVDKWDDEWLLLIKFPTGAYIFGDSYPEKTFKTFFDELKSYKPKYLDSVNKCLYFDKSTAKDVIGDYKSIFKKYQGMVAEEVKQQKISKLQAELKRLEE